MQYEPLKHRIDRFISKHVFLKKVFFLLLDIYLLRTWHVHKELRKFSKTKSYHLAVLDAGAGFGQYSWFILRTFKKVNVTAVDVSEEHVLKARRFFAKAGYPNAQFQTEDLTRFCDENAFDLILSVDVMEHILDDRNVFGNFYQSLKSEGMLLISTPSDQGGSGVHDHDEEESFIDEHVRDGYAVSDIREKLESAGFKKVEAKYTYGSPGKISWLLQMKIPVTLLNNSRFFVLLLMIYIPVIIFPCLILNFFDTVLKHKSGTGLLVKAWK